MNRPLIAVKAERRTIAVAIFRGHILRYAESLNLASVSEVANASAKDFVLRVAGRFDVQVAALEDAHAAEETRSAELLDHVESALRTDGIPTTRVPKQIIFESFAVTPLTSRRQVHDILSTFWPLLNTADFSRAVIDAAAVGLYEDTERRLAA